VHVGDVVRANDPSSAIVTIHQLRPIRVRFTIPQADMSQLQGERPHDVRVYVVHDDSDSAKAEGSLAFVDNQVDAASGTLMLKGEFANQDASLWPGAFVRVRLQLHEQQGATVVPTAAVNNSQSGSYCYVVKPDTTVELRPVSVSRSWQDLTVIASGLAAGETVVTDGQVRLSPGAHALVRTPQSAAAAAAPGAPGTAGRHVGKGAPEQANPAHGARAAGSDPPGERAQAAADGHRP